MTPPALSRTTPIITAEMTSSSHPRAAVGVPDMICDETRIPARNEQSDAIPIYYWCPGRESNPHTLADKGF